MNMCDFDIKYVEMFGKVKNFVRHTHTHSLARQFTDNFPIFKELPTILSSKLHQKTDINIYLGNRFSIISRDFSSHSIFSQFHRLSISCAYNRL